MELVHAQRTARPTPEKGCHKPDPRMYRHASEALGLAPDECLFYEARAVLRVPPPQPCPVPSVTTLDEILPLF